MTHEFLNRKNSGRVVVWNIRLTPELVSVVQLQELNGRFAALSRDGSFIAVLDNSGDSIRIWSVPERKELCTLKRQNSGLNR